MDFTYLAGSVDVTIIKGITENIQLFLGDEF